ncbi:uroporphyrinogen-III C-methyltransferase [Sphingomonas sp. H39-1-10]|uniref:uroporphyrinogen-III C-methyltransferase n=1 Tax=Sphingomonas pollutisoli TaxID=3030829 RepID=UPI0023B9A410|nr:uroporphyrinogen-III C-methyltransferase [Sphingomonas pollutisoli]MDF0489616.1 uroporphyrinogen-III C-methyltransferase [Sphingomonas pollutisoli]
MSEPIAPGEVWLVGAGPGDPDLLTRKAERLIRAADIVFHDALVGPGVLALIHPHAERVSVGKRSGRHSRTQAAIDALLVQAARAGKRVVRLKGGDPSIFGRSTEEIAALSDHGIRVRICPGITAASAAAAHAGVSLTLRGTARQLRFVTAHARAGETLDLDWAALADPGATLAFYMGRAAAPDICQRLIAHGLAPTTPALIASDVSLASECLVHTRLDLLALAIDRTPGAAPALILIGEAMRAPPATAVTEALETVARRE